MPTRKHSKKSDDAAKSPKERGEAPAGRRRAHRAAAPPSVPPPESQSEPPPSSEIYATFDAPREPVPTEPPESERTDEPVAAAPATVDEVQDQIRKLELQLDRMIQKSKKKAAVPEGHAERAARAIAEKLSVPGDLERPGGDEGGVMDAARELLSSDYYLRQWGRIAMRNRSEEVD